MDHRYAGEDGRQTLIAALRRQEIVQDDAEVAALLAGSAEVVEAPSGTVIIDRDEDDNSLFFLLAGEASVMVHGSTIALRKQHQHIGEMALIDPSATRSAYVVAHGDAVLARVPEHRFVDIADAHPVLWRRLAIELGSRLRVRNGEVRIPNPTPIVFIGATGASTAIAQAMKDALEEAGLVVRVWDGSGLYGDARFAVDSFTHQVAGSDFALLAVGADAAAAEDGPWLHDAIFFAGSFVGALGKARTLVVRPQALRLSLPSDHLGLATVTFGGDDAQRPADVASAALSLVLRRIEKLGPR